MVEHYTENVGVGGSSPPLGTSPLPGGPRGGTAPDMTATTQAALQRFFAPDSIAVIGASTKPGSVGNSLTENLLRYGYTGKIYPINPKTETLFSVTFLYP